MAHALRLPDSIGQLNQRVKDFLAKITKKTNLTNSTKTTKFQHFLGLAAILLVVLTSLLKEAKLLPTRIAIRLIHSYMNVHQQKLLELARKKDINRMTRQALAKEVGLKYPSHVFYHLMRLVDEGILRYTDERQFFINSAYSEGRAGFWKMPILGSATCGDATAFADEVVEGYVSISTRYAPDDEKWFAVRASGDSMNKANVNGQSIEDGDLVVVNPNNKLPKNGDYVLSVIDGLANIKRFYQDENGQITLVSESTSQHEPIYIHPDDPLSYVVAGIVKHVLKKPVTSPDTLTSQE